MALNITTTSSILESHPGRRGDVSRLTSEIEAAMLDVNNENKYKSRADLDVSGQNRLYDETQQTILLAEGNKVNAQIVSAKLGNESRAFLDFCDVIVDLQIEIAQRFDHLGTDADKVDRALDKITNILTRKDSAGEYVWSGTTAARNALSKLDKNGDVVLVDLKAESSLIDGKPAKNYSDIAPNETVVTVSSLHDVKKSFLYPGMDAVSKTLGYLNMLKAGTATPQELDVARMDGRKARGEAEMLIALEEKKVEDSLSVNNSDINRATLRNTESFKNDAVQSISALNDLMNSLKALTTVKSLGNKVFDSLMDRMRV